MLKCPRTQALFFAQHDYVPILALHIAVDLDVCTSTVLTRPSSSPTHVFCPLPGTLVLRPMADQSWQPYSPPTSC